ncbi:hypothetical protein ACVXHB_11490 [Escherichia coli]
MTGEAIAGILLLTGAALVVIAALLVSGLRIVYRISTLAFRKSSKTEPPDRHAG